MSEEIKNEKSKIKMLDEKESLKKDFKRRLYEFTLALIEFIDKLPRDNTSRRLGDQLLRSGTSVIGNFVEGKSASSRRDFINYYTISLKSANETKLWLSLLKDSKRARSDEVEELLREMDEISRILAASILTLKKRK